MSRRVSSEKVQARYSIICGLGSLYSNLNSVDQELRNYLSTANNAVGGSNSQGDRELIQYMQTALKDIEDGMRGTQNAKNMASSLDTTEEVPDDDQ